MRVFDQADLSIGKIRSSSSGADSSALRMAVTSFIQHADLHPTDLPSSVILVIRQLSDPLPGSVPDQIQGRLRHAQWEAAVRDQISVCYHAAQRPVKGIVNADADAVLFADYGELIACLSLDIVSKAVDGRWWWRQVMQQFMRQNVDTKKLAEIWKQSIPTLPATISYLLQWGNAGAVISSLDKGDADILTESLAQVHSLDLLQHELANKHGPRQSGFADPLSDQETWQQSSADQFDHASEKAGFRSLTSLWKEQLSATPVPVNLPTEQLRLLFLGAVLHRSPWRAKHRQWQRELVSAEADTGDQTARGGSARQSMPRNQGLSDAKASLATQSEVTTRRATRLRSVQNRSVTPSDSPAPVRADRPGEFDDGDSMQPDKHSARTSQPTSHSEQMVENTQPQQDIENSISASTDDNVERETGSVDRVDAPPAQASAVQQSIGESSQAEVTTDLGGALYLLNLCAWLDIPDCFVNAWPDAAPPSAWAVMEALTLALLGDAGREYEDDALWPLLAELDGREPGMPLGCGMVFPERFSLPLEWLNILKKSGDAMHSSSCYSISENRLLLWCEEFLLGSEPLQAEVEAGVQAQGLLDRYPLIKTAKLQHALLPDFLDPKPTEPMTASTIAGFIEWFHDVFPFLRLVLMRQCGFDDPDDLGGLLRCRGRVQLTRTHLDFHAPMEFISMPVREAGLDQDPGWCPLVGRVVQFHFH